MSPDKHVRIMIVEDHPVFSEGLSMIIGAEKDLLVVGDASTADAAVELYRRLMPDLILMDECLPGASGTDTMLQIRTEFPQARFMMLTTSNGDVEIQRAIRAGASAYVLKNTPKEELLKIIRTVSRGRNYMPSDVTRCLAEHMGHEELTTRETEVIQLIRDGYKNKQIADRLSIAESTVNYHIKNIVDKLMAKDRTHAVMIAIRRGLLRI